MKYTDIKKIGISGAGTVGSGIAQIFARQGYEVILADIKEEMLDKSRGLIEVFNSSFIDEGMMDEKEIQSIFEHIVFTTDIAKFNDVDIVIEAIVENLALKQNYWEEMEKIAREDTIFATNTSGLSINEVSLKIKNKARFIGSHFWNPAHIIPLVELIKTEETSEETVKLMKEILDQVGKVSVVVQKDTYGFIGNRLQFAAFREAVNIVEKGIASPEDVDKAMKYGPGFRYPIIGPLETADLGGLDTFYNISTYLYEDLADNKTPQVMVEKMMKNEELGVKSKKGFYDYSNGKDTEVIRYRDKMFFEMLKHISQK